MPKPFPRAALFAALLLPIPLSAQGIALAARAGTLGLGGEAALGLGSRLVVRGGYGVMPYEYDGTFQGETYTVALPKSYASAGVDFYPFGSGIRLMGGFLRRSGDVELSATFSGSRRIGDKDYTSSGTLEATVVQEKTTPFLGIGFGKHTAGGFGLFLDLGVALVGEPADVKLVASGPVATLPGIQQDLAREEAKIENDYGTFLQYWPILSLGLKLPLGGGR